MRVVMENLTGVALAAALALVVGAGEAQAAPFRIVSDGPDSVWVLDAASGELTWCRATAPTGPKVLDVFGESAQQRPQATYRSQPDCSEVLAAATDERAVRARSYFAQGVDRRIGGFGDGYRDGDYAGFGPSYRGYGTYGSTSYFGDYSLDTSGGQINIVRPRYVDITVN